MKQLYKFKKCHLVTAISAVVLSGFSFASTAQERDNKNDIEEVVVKGEIGYRNRIDGSEQILEYDRSYFERFEPSSAGDALKRVPSVTFLSDVTESDGARLRGLNPGYTQILINGEAVPGIGSDRSFLLDRIPAELIDRVEVIRSNSASRSGDGLAGAINIVLRDSFSLDGAYVKLGGALYDDNEVKESLAAIWGGNIAGGRAVIGANRQGRLNPKVKKSLRYDDSPENNPNFASQEFANREDQTDVRDSTDTSVNLDYKRLFGNGGELSFDSVVVDTQREENERSFEYDDLTAKTGPINEGGNLETDNQQQKVIEQLNYSMNLGYSLPLHTGKLDFKLGYAKFDSENDDRESELDVTESIYVIEDERELTNIDDSEISLDVSYSQAFLTEQEIEFGVSLKDKDRDTSILAGDNERDLAPGTTWDQFSGTRPLDIATNITNIEAIEGGLNTIEEARSDAYALIKGKNTRLDWEAGLRYEHTDFTISDESTGSALQTKHDYAHVLPSAHVRYSITDQDRLMLSVAKSVRRPDFNYLTPALIETEVADNDLQGNPNLEPETAIGIDVGYEHRIGRQGVLGLNLFYRDIEDKIELVNTGLEGSEGPGFFIYKPENIGEGSVQGAEFDLSMPLELIAMPNTGVFFNYSYIDSEVTDVLGDRRFNDQPKWVYNIGFIQDLPSVAASFGATYREQGDAYGRVIAEEVTTSYGADLELFLEKRWSAATLRLVASNLLDGSKDEVFNGFESLDDQQSRSFDEYELETEEAGPVYRLSLRIAL